ncbi:hypothetical protein WR25_02774 isoform A [Diploscapter pachys]|uniref:Myosin motor domain-containing protein n=1 Tax=Diploscapter pachys TaxID=2018661 RepID=A0A2A2L5W9_9BILA|nr:hypothetical protein WR25_02774 isoform A [Diploscapter pachys]
MVYVTKGDLIWIEPMQGQADSMPIGARVVDQDRGRLKVVDLDDSGNEQWLSAERKIRLMHPTSVQGVADMCQLGDYHQSAILRNLLIRYRERLIYTYVGSILLAVNPYQDIPIYTAEQIRMYKGKKIGELPPHIFAIGDNCFQNMVKTGCNQSIVISGESGAGKTESTKILLQFLATISGQHSWIEQQVLEANPILEAFGNAKTIRNDNSSRFGKYIEVHFTHLGNIEGARIENYLLEKSRIVAQQENERNYHIFYCLLAGLSAEERKDLDLAAASDYYYLVQGKTLRAEGRDDAADLAEIRSALKVLMFKEHEIWNIFKVLAAILHIGNVKFKANVIDNLESVNVCDAENIVRIAGLLQLREQDVIDSLTTRTMATRDERVVSRLAATQAIDARDSISKAVYSRLFSHILSRINDSIYKPNSNGLKRTSIGILDIFGFENFENNSFEQLCINYANEHLQQFFVQHIFKMEQKEYDEEEINWRHIRFTDNQVTLDLIADKPMSIMSLIDEESIFPKGTDKTMLAKLNSNHGKHEFYLKSKSDLQKIFGVNHYAGAVFYNSKGFLEKNRDTLSSDLVALMLSSKMPFVVRLFDDVCYDNAQRKKGATVSMQFRRSLDSLMLQLSQTQPFFIRCIKPNDFKRALVIDSELVVRQLRYSGMLDTIRIRRCGYPVRHLYASFVDRYRVLVNGIGPSHRVDCYAATKAICKKALGDDTDFQLGKTKVFLKEKDDLKLEQEYYRKLHERATVIQKQVRGWLQRRQFRKKKEAAVKIQKIWRGYAARKKYQQILNGICRLQAILRTRRLMLHYQSLRALIINFQAQCKGCLIRRELTEMKKKGEKRAMSPEREEPVKIEEIKEDELVGQLFDFLPSDKDSVEDESHSTLRSQPATQLIETPPLEDFSKFQFGKFAATFFLGQATSSHVKKPLTVALLAHNDQRNQKSALALWITILRFMGDLPDVKQSTNAEANDKTAVMNRLYTTLGRNYSWRQEEEAANAKAMKKGGMGKLISMTLKRKSGTSELTMSESSDSSCSSLNSLLEGKQMSSLEKLHFIIGMGILKEDLRDEIYCQLCKQLTENSSKLSAARGWILLSLCVGCFAPSEKFINYLYCFIREKGPSGTGYASYIEQRLRRTQKNGTRHQPPSYVELQANKSKKPVVLAITLMDGSVKTVHADSASTSKEVCTLLAEKIGLTDSFGFSLYIALFDKVSSLGSGGDHVLDAISQCEQYAKELGKQERNAPWRLFFRKEIFVPWHDSKIDAVSTNLIYQQIIRGIKYGEYRCDKEEDLAALIAQQHYIDGGTLQVDKLEASIAAYLPDFEMNGKQQLTQEKWVQAVMHQYRKKFTGRQPSPLEVKEDVVSFAKFKWPLLFSRFYEALKFAGPPLPKNEVILAVNWTGLYVVNDREQVLLEFTYPHISSIRFCKGKRRGTDTVVISTVGAEEYSFQSPNADDVVQLVNEFIDGLKKRSKYLLAIKAQKDSENESYLQFEKGDLLILIDGYNGASLLRENVVKGENAQTCLIGLIRSENVYVLPSLMKPSRNVLDLFPKDIEMNADALNNNNKMVSIERDGEPHTLRLFAESNFREPGKRVSLMTLRKREAQTEKWKFSREPLEHPLLKKLEGREDACRAAVDSYLCILKYMGDVPTKRSRLGTELTDRIFKPAINMEVLRDELYCQLMKQLTSNPSIVSEERGWELLWLAAGLFAPSPSLLKEVSLFLKSRPHPIALDCHNRMQKLAKGGSRKYPPHLVEVEAIQHKTTQIFHRVFFPDHSDEAIEVDSATRARDFATRITQRLHIKNSAGFSLFVKIKEKVLAVPEQEFFFDFVRQLSDWVQTNYQASYNPKESPIVPINYQVFFMRKLWKNVAPGEDPRADIIFHYYQECPKYLLGYHKTTKQDVILLAALILRAITKDNKNAPLAQIPQLINDLIPKNMVKLHNTNEWKKIISSAYTPVEHLSSDQAKIDFLRYISKWPTFGSAFFPVSLEHES